MIFIRFDLCSARCRCVVNNFYHVWWAHNRSRTNIHKLHTHTTAPNMPDNIYHALQWLLGSNSCGFCFNVAFAVYFLCDYYVLLIICLPPVIINRSISKPTKNHLTINQNGSSTDNNNNKQQCQTCTHTIENKTNEKCKQQIKETNCWAPHTIQCVHENTSKCRCLSLTLFASLIHSIFYWHRGTFIEQIINSIVGGVTAAAATAVAFARLLCLLSSSSINQSRSFLCVYRFGYTFTPKLRPFIYLFLICQWVAICGCVLECFHFSNSSGEILSIFHQFLKLLAQDKL